MEDLVRRAQQGDAFALDALVTELAPYVGRICGAVALDRGDDAMQEAMIAVVRHLGSLRDAAAIKGWVRRIAVREAVRQAAPRRARPSDPHDFAVTAEVSDHATAVEVRAVLESLDPEQRAVLVLRHVDGLSEEEMAEVLGVARGTVKSRLHRARAAFKERWSA